MNMVDELTSDISEYINNLLVVFSVNITQKHNEKLNKWKKSIEFPSKWTSFTLKKSFYNKNYNGLAILTGKINNLIVIDIDNVKHWEQLLTEQNKKEPDTVKVISGSGGRHLYFEYDEELKDITSKNFLFWPRL